MRSRKGKGELMAKRVAKFRVGQVVMVNSGSDTYPVKLVRETRIGNAEEKGGRWFDTLGNVEYEVRMRKLTKHEAGC
jgi:hypothetical protein